MPTSNRSSRARRAIAAFMLAALTVSLCACDESVADDDASQSFPDEVRHFTEADGLAWSHVHASAACPNGVTWFAYGTGGNGITRFNGSAWQNFNESDGLSSDNVSALACDGSNTLWIGYGVNAGGLTKFDGSTWITYTEEDGLTSDRIETISAGPAGEIWIAFGTQTNGVDRLR